MCFFQDIFLSIGAFYFLYYIYTEYVSKKVSRKIIENYQIFILGSFLILFLQPSITRYFLLDSLILLAYREREYFIGIFLSFLFGCILFTIDTTLCFWSFLILLGYLSIFLFCSKENRKKEEIALIWKGFLLSILLFQKNTFPPFSILALFFLLIIQDFLLLKTTPILIEEGSMTELEKNLFKITHEIKNPIAVCKGYLDMLNPKDTKKAQKYIPIIKSEIARTLVIMEDFMSIHNVTIHPDIMDFYLLMEDLEETLTLLLKEKKCTLKVPKNKGELFLFADYDRLKQVFINLIKNSLEANAKSISIVHQVKESELIITVTDTGEGISEENFHHLGELFFTTKSAGTGVGVHLSEEIIHLHRGKIDYHSKLGKGTKIIIKLPLLKDK